MSGTFAQNRTAALLVFDRGPEGEAFATGLGAVQDEEIAKARDAALMRYADRAPADALDLVGNTFRRARSPRETNTDELYRARIVEAWDFWTKAPRPLGLTEMLSPYWHDDYRPIWRSNYNGAIDGLQYWISRVWGIWPGTLLDDSVWSSSASQTWGDGGLWGLYYDPALPYQKPSFGIADLAWFRNQIRLVKGSTAYPVLMAVGTAVDAFGDAAIWGDGALWGDGGLWGNPGPETIRYLAIGRLWGDCAIYGGGPGLWGETSDTWDNYVPPIYPAV